MVTLNESYGMDKNPKVSVMLPSYKHPLWIGEAIESVMNQTFSDIELVVVDDGSKDGSAEIIETYACRDPRIKYEIFPKNKGAVAAIRRCYELCSADYIAMISSDDVWELDKLEKQIPVLDNEENIGAVFGMPTFIDYNGEPIEVSKNEFAPSLKLKTREEWMNYFFKEKNCICHPTILIRRACYDNIGFYNPTLRSIPDLEMWVRLFYCYDIKVLDDKLIKFRKHDFNEGDPHHATAIRCQAEYKQVLHSFLRQTKTVKELEAIFPENADLFKIKDDILVPFYIAQIALHRKAPFSLDFAFDVLYRELSKPQVLKIIEKYNLYSTVQLSKDVVSEDIYAMDNEKVRFDQVYKSRSWRYTAPFRKIGAFTRKFIK